MSTQTATSLALTVVPLMMVMGLLAPFFGPAIDHHFVDRSPAHAHIFVGDATNEHVHLSALTLASDDHDHSSGVNGDGVSVLSTSVSSAQSPLTLDGATIESLIPSYESHLTALYFGELPVADGQVIAPLGRPPRFG